MNLFIKKYARCACSGSGFRDCVDEVFSVYKTTQSFKTQRPVGEICKFTHKKSLLNVVERFSMCEIKYIPPLLLF